ncbi:glycoside hydrolase family 29, partial [Salinisphaera sp. USBA-960]|nr:glycoside hydrolase family 29 [Salifodinibacter halophilus]
GGWQTIAWGTTIGCKRLERFEPVRAQRLRLTIEHAYDLPRIATVAVYRSRPT